MAIEISDAAGIGLIQTYVDLRDAPRMLMARQIYGVAKRTLTEYQKLVDFLSENEEYALLHTATTAQVQPHIQTMIDALASVVGTMEAVEAAAPGTFPGVGS